MASACKVPEESSMVDDSILDMEDRQSTGKHDDERRYMKSC